MAQSISLPQIPQHVSALLSHLSARPGVQSTLILSRKDGSIIQCTGLLASSPSPSPNRNNSITTTAPDSAVDIPPASSSADAGVPASLNEVASPTAAGSTATHSTPYKPSQAEALAAHIHAFVSSASSLSDSLCHPIASNTRTENRQSPSHLSRGGVNGIGDTGSPSYAADEEVEAEGPEREDESEVKLLRLRTKRHEIVVVPDRRFLLCVVHDVAAASSTTGGSSGGGGVSR